MARVYECVQWNPATETCDMAAWIERASWLDVLPTLEQAQTVGVAIFASLVILASFSLLIPPRSITDD